MFEVVVTLVFTAVMLLFSLVAAVVSMLVPLAILFVVYRNLQNGGAIVVHSPLLGAIAAAQAQQQAAAVATGGRGTGLVKVGRCPTCAAPRSRPSPTAYVHCDSCGQLMDWDFRAAMSDRRSRAPGPAYEQLLVRARPGLEAAKAAGDLDAYTQVQKQLWREYARLCPAACPPRVGDPAYLDRWVDWSARSQAEQDIDPGCRASFDAQQAATSALRWDRSNPFQPKAELTSYRALLDAVIAHQEQVVGHLDRAGLLADHPDHPDAAILRKIGVAAFVQGWLPYLPQSEHDVTLARTGLDGEYVAPQPVDLTEGACPSCSAKLEVLADAKRVVCTGCGHAVSVNGGTLPCHGCAAQVEIPRDAKSFQCPYCEIRIERLI